MCSVFCLWMFVSIHLFQYLLLSSDDQQRFGYFACMYIFTENVGSGEDLFEGDMRLNVQQRAVANGQNGRGSIRTGKWTGAVLTYVIDSSLGKGFLIISVEYIVSSLTQCSCKDLVRWTHTTTTTTTAATTTTTTTIYLYPERTGRDKLRHKTRMVKIGTGLIISYCISC